MAQLNILKQNYSPWRYISNWPRNIKLFFRRYKWAYQRATRGYCDYDIWDLDYFYTNLFVESLNQMANVAEGYPGNEKFPTYESWTRYLRKVARLFYQSLEANNYYATPEEEKWWDWIQKHPRSKDNPFSDSMINEAKENDKKRNADFEKAWEMMGEIHGNLWD